MSRRFTVTVWGLAAAIIAAGQLAHSAGFRINHTASLPTGLWRITPANGPIRRGDIVSICPPDTDVFRTARAHGYLLSGVCPGGYEPLLKPVAAVAGDTVTINAGGTSVNGVLIANSRAHAQDAAGSPLPVLPRRTYRVAGGELWLISSFNPASFDSRYFGPVPAHSVRSRARPVWTAEIPFALTAAMVDIAPASALVPAAGKAMRNGEFQGGCYGGVPLKSAVALIQAVCWQGRPAHMAKTLSLDLRERVIAAVSDGTSRRQAAERFGVSAASAIRWCARERETGSAAPKRRNSTGLRTGKNLTNAYTHYGRLIHSTNSELGYGEGGSDQVTHQIASRQ